MLMLPRNAVRSRVFCRKKKLLSLSTKVAPNCPHTSQIRSFSRLILSFGLAGGSMLLTFSESQRSLAFDTRLTRFTLMSTKICSISASLNPHTMNISPTPFVISARSSSLEISMNVSSVCMCILTAFRSEVVTPCTLSIVASATRSAFLFRVLCLFCLLTRY